MNAAIPFEPTYEQFRGILLTISGFYFVDRYPFVLESGLIEDDIRRAMAETMPVITAIRSHFKK